MFISINIAFASNKGALAKDWQYIGQPIIEHFNTLDMISNPQNYEIKQDDKGYIYVGNGNGILIYNGKTWQNLAPADQQAMRDFALTDNGRIYAGQAGDLGYFEADEHGEWLFVSILDQVNSPPDIKYVYKVKQINDYIVFLTDTHLFYYLPSTGLSWHEQEIYPIDAKQSGHDLLVTTRHGKLLTFNSSLSFALIRTQSLIPRGKSLASETVFGFAEIKGNNHLIHTDKKIIVVGQNSEIRDYKTEITQWLSQNSISKMVEISNQRIAIATHKGGIAIINKEGQLIRFINTNHGLTNNGINSIFADREDNLWAASNTNGVFRIELDSNISHFPSKDEFFLSTSIADFKGQTFMGAQHGLFVLKPAQTPYEQAKFVKLDFNYATVMNLLTIDDTLLIGHQKGVDVLTIDQQGVYHTQKLTNQQNNPITHVRKIIIDNQNPNIAFAITARGLVKIQRVDGQWQSLGLMDNFDKRLYSIHQQLDGELWIGSNLGQYFHISQHKNWPSTEIEQLDYPQLNPPMAGNSVRLADKSLFNNGVDQVVMTLSKDKKRLVPAEFADWQSQEVTGLMSLIPSNNNQAWFLSWINNMNMDRVGRLTPKLDGTYTVDFLDLDQLRLEFTLGLYQNQQDVLWINSKGKIIRYDPRVKRQKRSLFLPVLNQITEIGSEALLFNHAEFAHRKKAVNLSAEQNAIKIDFTVADFTHSNTRQFRYRLTDKQTKWSEWQAKSSAIFTNLAPGELQFELQYRTTPSWLSPILKFAIHRQPYWYQSLIGQLSIGLVSFLLLFFIAWGIARARIKHLHQRAKKLETQVRERTLVIEQKNTQLKQMDEAKNRFFANISHEFRTPLSLAIGPLKDVIAGGRVSDQKDLDYLKISLTNNLHMMELLSQVLDINKLEANGMPLNIVKMELTGNLQYCIQRFQQLSEKHSVSFKTIGFENNLSIYFDADHFEKIILNLLSNAVKFSPANSQITIKVAVNEKDVEISVIDQGIGISPQDLPHIFSRFYQGQQSSKTFQPGTGIGLSLVKELVTLHHGKIKVKSSPAEGSCFCLTFLRGNDHYQNNPISEQEYVIPLSKGVTPIELSTSNDKQTNSPTMTDNSSKTLLIIDDNSDLRAYIRSSLESTYKIIEASNGRTGLQSAQTNQPDLIVSDVMMPVMDGLQLASELKSSQQTAHIPLILLTAKSTKRDTVEGLQQGADDYLSKPFDSAELAARIASQLAQKQRIAEKIRTDFAQQPQEVLSSDLADENSDDFKNKINQLLNDNMGDEDFDVEKMYQSLNITRSTLFRQIKKTFSCTPNQLLKLRRLEVALKMLQQNKGSISEIGYAAGFQSLSVFSRAFSDQYQVPPSRFSEI